MDRVAILGFGSSGQRFLQLVKRWNPRAQVLVYSSRNLSSHRLASTSRLGDVTAFEPEIAIVCGSATERLAMISVLPPSLSGVLIEKPLATDPELAQEILRLLDGAVAVARVGYNLRFSPSLIDFRRRLVGGEFGSVFSVRAETGQFLPNWRPDRDYRHTVSARAILGGGVLLELSHEIDYLQWLFGKIEWVSAVVGRQSELEIDVDDSAHLTLGFAASAGGNQLVGQVNLDLLRHDTTRSVTALCSDGSLRWDGVAGRVEALEAGQSSWETVFGDNPASSTYDLQWEAFISAVRGSSSPGATLSDGLDVLQVVSAARLSSAGGGIRTSVLAESAAP